MIKIATLSKWSNWQWLRWLLGLAILVGLFWHWSKLAQDFDWPLFKQQLQSPANRGRLLVVLLLMPINWLLETRKWQLFVLRYHDWNFRKCFKAVIVGIGASSFTPNRIGEIGGRAVLAKKEEVPGILAATLQGSLCQWLAFLLLAWPGLVWVGGDLLPASWQAFRWWLLPLGPLLVVVLLRFGLPQVLPFLRWLQGKTSYLSDELIAGIATVKLALILRAGAYACLRFAVYCTQIYLLLQLGGLELPYWYAMAGIAGVYLLQAGLPLPPGINLMVRAELASLLFGQTAATTAAGLTAFGLLFVVNVLLPTLPAVWLIVKKEKRDEN